MHRLGNVILLSASWNTNKRQLRRPLSDTKNQAGSQGSRGPNPWFEVPGPSTTTTGCILDSRNLLQIKPSPWKRIANCHKSRGCSTHRLRSMERSARHLSQQRSAYLWQTILCPPPPANNRSGSRALFPPSKAVRGSLGFN